MITLRPTGGLGNRILAIDSAVKLCKLINQDLHIHWLNNKYINCSYFDLFEPFDLEPGLNLTFTITDKKSILFSEKELYQPKQRVYNALLGFYQSLYFDKVIRAYHIKSMVESGYNFKELKEYNKVLISSYSRFTPGPINATYFKPIKKIQVEIDRISKEFSPFTIGIHIRRGDHLQAIKESPTELFIYKMHEEISNNPNVTFFLASDSEADKKRLKSEFGKQVLLNELNDGDRNSISGMNQAVIDLFCLGNTSKIYGSATSTFSLIASEIRNIQFEELKLKTPL